MVPFLLPVARWQQGNQPASRKKANKKTRRSGFFQFLQRPLPVEGKVLRLELLRNDVRSSRAFLALLDGELNALTFFQGFETVGLDGGEVNEHVFAAVSRGDETEAFLGVEEFYGTSHFGHDNFLE